MLAEAREITAGKLEVDDCGERINPTIVERQVHGGVTDLDMPLTPESVWTAIREAQE